MHVCRNCRYIHKQSAHPVARSTRSIKAPVCRKHLGPPVPYPSVWDRLRLAYEVHRLRNDATVRTSETRPRLNSAQRTRTKSAAQSAPILWSVLCSANDHERRSGRVRVGPSAGGGGTRVRCAGRSEDRVTHRDVAERRPTVYDRVIRRRLGSCKRHWTDPRVPMADGWDRPPLTVSQSV